jgi:short-subunit dehydrogenase
MKGKVAIVTGASSGIGKALAFELAGRGAHVVLAARNIEKLEAIADEIRNKGFDALPVKVDVTVEDDCKKLIGAALDKYHTIDILINNAGISMRALFNDTDLDVIRKLMDVNFWGTVYCTKYALPHILKSKGSVVGISSIAGFNGLPGRTGYSASKFAIQGFLETLRIENRRNGLHVLIACPGFTASNIRTTALNANGNMQGESPREELKMMTAEATAKHIVNAIQKRKKILILTLQGKMTVWMGRFFPLFLDRMIYNHMAKEPGSPFK